MTIKQYFLQARDLTLNIISKKIIKFLIKFSRALTVLRVPRASEASRRRVPRRVCVWG